MKTEDTRELVKFRAEPEIRKALKLRAAYDDSNITIVVLDALRTYLADQLEEVRQRMASAPVGTKREKESNRLKS
jgi:hypothetical protein